MTERRLFFVRRAVRPLYVVVLLAVIALAATMLSRNLSPISSGRASSALLPSSLLVRGMALSPGYSADGTGYVWGTSSNGAKHLWVTQSSGASWSETTATRWSGSDLVVRPLPGHMHALTAPDGQGLQVSYDKGATFTHLADPALVPGASSRLAGLPSTIVVAGQSVLVTSGVPIPQDWSGNVLVVGVSGTAPNQIVFATCSAELVCEQTVAVGPSSSGAGLPQLSISPTYSVDHVAFVRTLAGLWVTTDAGASFNQVGQELADRARSGFGVVNYSDAVFGRARDIYVSAWSGGASRDASGRMRAWQTGGVWKTSDRGATWTRITPVSGPLSLGSTAIMVTPDGTLFDGYLDWFHPVTGGVACSKDGGAHWLTTPCL